MKVLELLSFSVNCCLLFFLESMAPLLSLYSALSSFQTLMLLASLLASGFNLVVKYHVTKTNCFWSWGLLAHTTKRNWKSACCPSAQRKEGEDDPPPATRWQVLGKGRALAAATATCSQNRINIANHPLVYACAQLATDRLVIAPYLASKRARKSKKETKWRKIKKVDRARGSQREREKEFQNKKGKGKHSTERENRPACLAAQPPHDFDLRNR